MLIADFWTQWQEHKLSFPSILDWWDLGKNKIKGLSINYCKSRERYSSRSLLSNLALTVVLSLVLRFIIMSYIRFLVWTP